MSYCRAGWGHQNSVQQGQAERAHENHHNAAVGGVFQRLHKCDRGPPSRSRPGPSGTMARERASSVETFAAHSLVSELLIDMNPLGRGMTDDCLASQRRSMHEQS